MYEFMQGESSVANIILLLGFISTQLESSGRIFLGMYKDSL